MGKKSVIGESIPRLESGDKVTGELEYLEDVTIAGMLHGKMLRSSVPHAEVLRVDASRAETLPGVVAVLTGKDVVDNPRYQTYYGPVVKDQTIVAVDRVRFVGDPVAAVAATHPVIAEEALELIEVDYEELPAVLDPEEAVAEGAPLIHRKVRWPKEGFADLKDVEVLEGTNICNHVHIEKGDVEKGFAESDHIFEDLFTAPPTQHATLESFTSIARFERSGKLTIWSTTQNPFVIRDQMARLFRLPISQVRVISLNIGGGYGSKLYPKLEPLVSALAYKARRPVGITLTREEVFQTLTKHAARVYLKTGVKKDGTLVSRHCRVYLDTGAYAEIGPRVLKKSAYGVAGPYEIPNVLIDAYAVYTNRIPAGAFRGFGLTQANWGHESQMDMIAHRLGRDPVELRSQNLLDEGGEFVTGERMRFFGMRECLEKAAAAAEWGKELPEGGLGKARGRGVACVIKATLTPSISSAMIRLNEDGSASVYVGSVDIGQGSDTVMSQIASQELAIPIDQVSLVRSDTDSSLYDITTSSSRSTFHMGRALILAAQDVKKQLAEIAAPLFQVNPQELVFEDQSVKAGSGSSQVLSYHDLLIKHFGIKGVNILGRGMLKTDTVNEKGEHQHSAFWVAGTGVADVEVDKATGMVRLLRYVIAADVGKALNPMACEQQLRGATITGVGQALLEELAYQEGLPINPNFLDYNLPRFLDLPEKIETILVERPNPVGPYGAKGCGETALIPVSPAIANAVMDAVGVRIQDLPITPEKVFNALQKKEAQKSEEEGASND